MQAPAPGISAPRYSRPKPLLWQRGGDLGIRNNTLARQVIVIGTGPDALSVGQAIQRTAGFALVGYYPGSARETCVVPRGLVLSAKRSLDEAVRDFRAREMIVAVREQRGGSLPLAQLLSCRLRGVKVLDLHAFFERVTGEVPVEALKASWLIYGEGFRQGVLRNLIKRGFDLVASLLLLAVGLPIMLVTAVAIRMESRGPVLFRQTLEIPVPLRRPPVPSGFLSGFRIFPVPSNQNLPRGDAIIYRACLRVALYPS